MPVNGGYLKRNPTNNGIAKAEVYKKPCDSRVAFACWKFYRNITFNRNHMHKLYAMLDVQEVFG